MIKLKITIDHLKILNSFTFHTSAYIENEIEKFNFSPRTFELVQYKIQLEEMRVFIKKIKTCEIRKTGINNTKKFIFSISPIQSLLILTYVEMYKKQVFNEYASNVMNIQKDIIYKELLTK